jgi:sugar O-acyltransferase (sialic acid O-acetyltransferase NeuD family)
MKNKLVIFGLGDIAQLAHYYFSADSSYEVVAFTVDTAYLDRTEFCRLPVVAFEEIRDHYAPETHEIFVALSYSKLNQVRKEKYLAAKALGYRLASYVSSHCTVLNANKIGDNCFILEDNTIQPFATIGNNVTLWSGNHIGHHSTIHDHCFIASHVVISGCCTIEPFCFFGVNATVRDETVVARETLVGMSATIVKDTKEFEIYQATGTQPARVRSDQIRSLSHKSKG